MKSQLFEYLESRFGILPPKFKDFEFYGASRGRIFLGPKHIISRPEPVSVGILAARTGNAIKPTTNLLQLFGRHASKNIVNLNKENIMKYAKGESLLLTEQEKNSSSNGYVIVSYSSVPVGCGYLKDDSLDSLLPKAKRLSLKYL